MSKLVRKKIPPKCAVLVQSGPLVCMTMLSMRNECLFPMDQCGLGDPEAFAGCGSWSCSGSAWISECHSDPWPVWDQPPGRELHQSCAAPGMPEGHLRENQCEQHRLQEREEVFL